VINQVYPAPGSFSRQELFDVLVPKNGNVADLIAGLIRKAKLEDENIKGPIRMYETHNGKVYKELPRDYGVISITENVTLIAERIPEEEIDANPSHFINAFHFQNEPNKPHSIPFRFMIKPVSSFLYTSDDLDLLAGSRMRSSRRLRSG
jgi:ubiquitin carboxyl-terminal hydrolase 7